MNAIVAPTLFRAYPGYPGTNKGQVGLAKPSPTTKLPHLLLPNFSTPIILMKVAAGGFMKEQQALLEKGLVSLDRLAEVQFNFLVVKNVPEIRVVYLGGHLNACIDGQLSSLPLLAQMGKRVEVFLPLDLIYLGPEDFNSDLKSEAFDAKAAFLIERKSGIHQQLDRLLSVDYVIFFDGNMVEARGKEGIELNNPLVVRVFSTSEQMLEYLEIHPQG